MHVAGGRWQIAGGRWQGIDGRVRVAAGSCVYACTNGKHSHKEALHELGGEW